MGAAWSVAIIPPVSARSSVIAGKVEDLISRTRERGGQPLRDEIDHLYTDACAMVLTLESERMDVDRRLTGPPNGESPEQLVERRTKIVAELQELRGLTAQLSTAAEWFREPEAADVDDLRA